MADSGSGANATTSSRRRKEAETLTSGTLRLLMPAATQLCPRFDDVQVVLPGCWRLENPSLIVDFKPFVRDKYHGRVSAGTRAVFHSSAFREPNKSSGTITT